MKQQFSIIVMIVLMLGLVACASMPIGISLAPSPTPVVIVVTATPPPLTPPRVAATPAATLPAATPVKYNSVDWGFTLVVPQGWSIAKEWPGRPASPQQSNGVLFFSPKEDAEIFIGVRLHQNRSADQWMDDLEAQVPPDLQYRRVSRDTVKFQDVIAVRVESTFDRPPPYRPGHGPQRRKTFVLVRSQLVYEIDVTADAPMWEQYRPLFNDFLNQWAWYTTLLVRDTPTPQMTWTTFRSKEGHFSVSYPSGWKVTENPKGRVVPVGGQTVLLGEWEYDSVAVEIEVQPLALPKTPQDLAQAFIETQQKSVIIGRFQSKGITAATLGGLSGARVDHSFSTHQGSFVGVYVVTVRESTAYAVHVYAILSSGGTPMPGLESRQQIMEQIIASFMLE